MSPGTSSQAAVKQELPPVFQQRRAGVLLHPSSLPGGDGFGELGPDALRFVDFMADAGLSVWQVLPLGPTHEDLSPYMSLSVHAGNKQMISIDALQHEGCLSEADLVAHQGPCRHEELLQVAHDNFRQHASAERQQAYQAFCRQHEFWLEDYALYQALRQILDHQPWVAWPPEYRDRDSQALAGIQQQHGQLVDQVRFEQFLFFTQWETIKSYANARGIYIFGDMPIFVAHDSAEVWAQRQYFNLDDEGQPRTIAGVPPDYFSATGQHWGNPHYRWDVMAADGWLWWKQRIGTALEMFDLLRIDHFRGFEAYWEIPAGASLPSEGHWVPGPGAALFDALFAEFPQLPLVAEDLGIITPAVEALRDQYHLPGMKIMQFAFDGSPDNPYLPGHHIQNCLVYTGTHDNDTTLSWYQSLDEYTRAYVDDCLSAYAAEEMPWRLIAAALDSPAMLCMIPMQDLLQLGSEARMNTPGEVQNNWCWRFSWQQLSPTLAALVHVRLEQSRRLV